MSRNLTTIDIQKLPFYHFRAKSKSQEAFLDIIDNNQIILATGRAGTGKTITAIVRGLKGIMDGSYEKLVIIKPAVEAEENLGYLPGTIESKIYPYHYSTIYTIDMLIGKGERINMMKAGLIETIPIAYLRGITFHDTFMIIDEAQNTTKAQIKLIVTRIGQNSKMIFIGDAEQSDLNKNKNSGLLDAIDRLQDVNGIGTFAFSNKEIVRNSIITEILEKYE